MSSEQSTCKISRRIVSPRRRLLRLQVSLIAAVTLLPCSAPAHPQPLQKTQPQTSEASKVHMTGSAVTTAQSTPDFRLLGTDGNLHTLRQYQGRPVALFFFCGCPWCHRCATLWGQFQRGGALSPLKTHPFSGPGHPSAAPPSNHLLTSSGPSPLTLIVFSGDSASAGAFAAQTGLDLKQTVLLPDPDMRVTTLYKVDPCPRVFTLDPQGRMSYTNNHKDDAPQEAPELVMASRALDALRGAASANLPVPK